MKRIFKERCYKYIESNGDSNEHEEATSEEKLTVENLSDKDDNYEEKQNESKDSPVGKYTEYCPDESLQNKYNGREALNISGQVSTYPVSHQQNNEIYDHNIKGSLAHNENSPDTPVDQSLIKDSTKDFNDGENGTADYEPRPGTSNGSIAIKYRTTSPNNSVLDLSLKEPKKPNPSLKKLKKCYLYCCRCCDLKFPTTWELNRHKVTYCPGRFSKTRGTPNANVLVDKNLEELMEYYKTMPDVRHYDNLASRKPYTCFVCGITVRNFYSKMKEHMKTHCKDSILSCNECPKKYKNKSDLLIHMKSHSGERPFPCEFCDQKYKSKSELTAHKKRRHKEQYEHKQDLLIQMKTQSGERPFPCELCDKKYKSKGDLTQHQKRRHKKHLNKNPPCSSQIASGTKDFNNADNGTADYEHQPKSSNGSSTTQSFRTSPKSSVLDLSYKEKRSFSCNLCDQKYKSKGHLTGHRKREHKEH